LAVYFLKEGGDKFMKLYIGAKEIRVGSKVKTFRGKDAKVLRIVEPNRAGSTGRVYLGFKDGTLAEYYPGVINAEWKEA
jgi:hypothetical protein